MRLLMVLALAALAVGVFTASTPAANYGCISRQQCSQMEAKIRAVFPSYVEDTMVCISRRESGLNPRAANYGDSNGGSYGLLQLNGAHGPGGYATRAWIARQMDPDLHLREAYRLWKAGGLGPWGGGC